VDHAALVSTNLNLLVTLDVLLEEESVTRAAERLGVTQSAVSHALRQLREAFDDPLLVRGRAGLVATPHARALVAPLRHGLQVLNVVLRDDPRFDAATTRRSFTLGTTDFVAAVLGPELAAAFEREAPEAELHLRTPAGLAELESGEIDLYLMPYAASPGGPLKRRKVFDDGFACLVREGNPHVGKRLTPKRYAALGHVLISPQGEGLGVVDRALAAEGLARRIAVRVAFFTAAPEIVARTDHVLTAPSRLVERLGRVPGLRVMKPPVGLERFSIHEYWHERFDHDPAHEWLRERIAAIGAAL